MEYLILFLLLMGILFLLLKGPLESSKEKNKQNNNTPELSNKTKKFLKFLKEEKGIENTDELSGVVMLKLITEYAENLEPSNEKLLEKNISWSVQKQRKIENLSKKLKTTKNDIPTSTNELFALSEKNKNNEQELYNACENDQNISKTMDKYNYNKSELEDLYSMIRGAGGGQLIKGVYFFTNSSHT